jgi:hypothetical protein
MSIDSTKMKHVEGTNKIDFEPWTFVTDAEDLLNKLLAVLQREFTEIVRGEFVKHPPDLEFAAGWNSDFEGDPATMHVQLPLGANEDDGPTYALSLEASVDDVIFSHQTSKTGKVEGPEGQQICRSIAARLRELAAKLETACAVPGLGAPGINP